MCWLRSAGATIVADNSLLDSNFNKAIREIKTKPYRLEGTQIFLNNFGPPQYKSAEEYQRATGSKLPAVLTGSTEQASQDQVVLAADTAGAETNYFGPQKRALALYEEALEKLQLDGFVYPAAQMPPPDETSCSNATGGLVPRYGKLEMALPRKPF